LLSLFATPTLGLRFLRNYRRNPVGRLKSFSVSAFRLEKTAAQLRRVPIQREMTRRAVGLKSMERNASEWIGLLKEP
jgi:hypothetical protein